MSFKSQYTLLHDEHYQSIHTEKERRNQTWVSTQVSRVWVRKTSMNEEVWVMNHVGEVEAEAAVPPQTQRSSTKIHMVGWGERGELLWLVRYSKSLWGSIKPFLKRLRGPNQLRQHPPPHPFALHPPKSLSLSHLQQSYPRIRAWKQYKTINPLS